MNHTHQTQSGNEFRPRSRFRARTLIALAGFLLVAAFFLFSEHRAHLFGFLPFILLLACPLLHLFMHGGGHGNHGAGGERGSVRDEPRQHNHGGSG